MVSRWLMWSNSSVRNVGEGECGIVFGGRRGYDGGRLSCTDDRGGIEMGSGFCCFADCLGDIRSIEGVACV
jgi:hypothetical protein